MRTLEQKIEHLRATNASRDHLLKDGYRMLDAAEVAYILGFKDHRSAHRQSIPKTRYGWMAKDVKAYLDRGRTTVGAHRLKLVENVDRARGGKRRRSSSTDAPLWGPDAA